jgi:CDP-paratose 2-epimerase
MRYLITGGCGFLGCNLAHEALRCGAAVTLIDNLSRIGAAENLAWLRAKGDVRFAHVDMRCADDVSRVIAAERPERVFHLAGQVAMTTSLTAPRHDFEVNVIGGHNLLEAVRRHAADATVIYSSTNKVYGDLETLRYEEQPTRYCASDFPRGFDESLPLQFCSPYGCSKGSVDQYMLDYARMFGLNTVVFRHSSVFGVRQFSTFDQGWVGWFVKQALRARDDPGAKPFTISGNGKQVRDLLFVDDLVRCYFAAADTIEAARGKPFNIGGGMGNSLSLLELFALLERHLGVTLRFECLPWRQSDQKVFVADTSRAESVFGWRPSVGAEDGIRTMTGWMEHHGA